MVTNAIKKSHRKVEGCNFDIRKNLLEYDDVSETIADTHAEVVNIIINQFVLPESLQEL